MSKLDDYTRVEMSSRADWRNWLAKNYSRKNSIWLVTFKKPDSRHVSYNDVVEEALCFGWVDSLPRKLDDARSMLLMAPRKPNSAWSKLNKLRVEKLVGNGLMQPSGLASVVIAKKSGLWDKLNDVEDLKLPEDLSEALAKNRVAQINFEAFPRSVKRGILEWIIQAKKSDTRSARVAETVAKAKANIRANQWRQQ